MRLGVGLVAICLAVAGCGGADKDKSAARDATGSDPAASAADAPPEPVAASPVASPVPASAPAVAPAATAEPAGAPAPAGSVATFIALRPEGAVPPSSGRSPAQPGDPKDSFDHPAVGRYAGSRIALYRQKQYDAAALFHANVGNASKPAPTDLVTAEGRVTDIIYLAPVDRSPLEIFRSFQTALANAGFETAYRCTPTECLETVLAIKEAMAMPGISVQRAGSHALAAFRRSDGVRLNLAVTPYSQYEPRILLRVVEPAVMEQGVKVVDAAGIGRDVASAGKAVLYAIQFDTDKATLMPESDAQLQQIADWLKGAGGKALVVGHTDSQGGFGYNVGLSQRRAEAVVAALSGRYGVDRARLTAFGNGMAAPVASNRTPDGQARNRRVEVVEQP
jgi:outer membrane protein OmpA-like peptidoglycan-associated protein